MYCCLMSWWEDRGGGSCSIRNHRHGAPGMCECTLSMQLRACTGLLFCCCRQDKVCYSKPAELCPAVQTRRLAAALAASEERLEEFETPIQHADRLAFMGIQVLAWHRAHATLRVMAAPFASRPVKGRHAACAGSCSPLAEASLYKASNGHHFSGLTDETGLWQMNV